MIMIMMMLMSRGCIFWVCFVPNEVPSSLRMESFMALPSSIALRVSMFLSVAFLGTSDKTGSSISVDISGSN